MEKLVDLFERILPVYRDNDVIFRTLFFSRQSLDPYCEPDAVSYFFRVLFNTVQVGYLELIRSLIRTKHISEADEALALMRIWVNENKKGMTALIQAEMEFQTAFPTAGFVKP